MTSAVECRYHGRDFTSAEMALLRELIAGPPALNRNTLSKEFCRRIGWYKADGGLKDMMARVVMLAMHSDGRIQLPVDWTQRYNTTPVLIETFVETPRHTGAVYRASGWTRVGATQGRGRYDTRNRHDKPKKDMAAAPAQGLEAHPQPLESAGSRHRHGTDKRLPRTRSR